MSNLYKPTLYYFLDLRGFIHLIYSVHLRRNRESALGIKDKYTYYYLGMRSVGALTSVSESPSVLRVKLAV